MTTEKLKCVCQSTYQDQKYGNNVRLCNKVNKSENLYRCTVCGKEIKSYNK